MCVNQHRSGTLANSSKSLKSSVRASATTGGRNIASAPRVRASEGGRTRQRLVKAESRAWKDNRATGRASMLHEVCRETEVSE